MTPQIQIPLTSSVGSVVGQIRAVDADGGIHGQVKYQMISQHSLVSVDRNSGKVVIYWFFRESIIIDFSDRSPTVCRYA